MKLNPQTTAFVFPGQGSQAVGMGKELAETYPIAKETFDEADSVLGFALSQLMWNGRGGTQRNDQYAARLVHSFDCRVEDLCDSRAGLQAGDRGRTFAWRIISSDRLLARYLFPTGSDSSAHAVS